MSLASFRELANKSRRPLFVRSTDARLRSATGDILVIHGEVKLSICGRDVNFIIINNLDSIPILGSPELEQLGAKIDYENHQVDICGLKCINMDLGSVIADIGPADGGHFSDLLLEYQSLFYKEGDPLRPMVDVPKLTIETVGPPIAQRAYRAPLSKRFAIDQEIDNMLQSGTIRPSVSPWASPVLLVPKKNSTEMRFCVDYRKLNAATVKDRHPIPNIQELFDSLSGATIFSTLDLKSGYWQLEMDENSISKTAFTCHRGIFEFRRVPFGICNGPAVFQRTMNHILAPLLGKCVLVYLDDIVVFSRDATEHNKHLRKVFQLLERHCVTLNRKKCEFAKPEVELLGYCVSKRGIAPIPEKTEAIANLGRPRTVKQIRSFLGMTGYYRKCIPHYADLSEPLVDLTRRGRKFVWTDNCQKSFEQLKKALISAPIMAFPDVNKPYRLYTDASDFAVGAILVQTDEHGTERPIHFLSHQLSAVQRRWATVEKEAFAVIHALRKLRPYLYSADFIVLTDHKPLRSLFSNEMQNTKIQRWAVMLAEYGARIEHRQGKNNVRADMLSWIEHDQLSVITGTSSDPPPDVEPDGIGCRQLLEVDGIKPVELSQLQQQEFKEEWDLATDTDNDAETEIVNGILVSHRLPYAHARPYERILLPSQYRHQIIKRSHEETGHRATSGTLRRITETYVWPGLRRQVREYIRTCPVCVTHSRKHDRPPMGNMDIPPTPMQTIGIDFIGPYAPPDPQGNRYLLTVVDH